MIINALRFRKPVPGDSTQTVTWRFPTGVGKLRNVCCLVGPLEVLTGIAEALRFAMTGQASADRGEAMEAALHISDHAGDSWVIERSGTREERTRFLHNGKILTRETGESQLLAALHDDGAPSLSSPLGVYELWRDGDGFSAVPFGGGGALLDLKRLCLKQTRELSERCANLARQPTLIDTKLALDFAAALEPLHEQQRQLAARRAALETAINSTETPPEGSCAQLSADLSLLDDIEALLRSLNETPPKALREQLEKIDAALGEACAPYGIDARRGPPTPGEWQRPLELLCTLEMYRVMLQTLEKTRAVARDTLAPIAKERLQAMDRALTHDTRIVAELESCLTLFAIQTHASEPEKKPQTLLGKLAARAERKVERPASQPVSPEMDHARLATEHALRKLTELRARFEQGQQEHLGLEEAADEACATLRGDVERAAQQWEQLARERGLPVDMELGRLVRFVAGYATIADLWQRREQLMATVRTRKAQLAKLEQLVHSWRERTGSQKATALTNPAILIAEARGLAPFREDKRRQLQRLEEYRAKEAIWAQEKARLDDEAQFLDQAVTQVFSAMGLRPQPIVEAFFENARMLKALVAMQKDACVDEAIEAFTDTDEPAMVYLWRESECDNYLRLALLKRLDRAATPAFNLLLVADPVLGELLVKMGVGRAYLDEKAKPTAKGAGQAPVIKDRPKVSTPATPLMSAKARAVLDVLATKRRY